MTIELVQSAFSSVVEATYFFILLNLSAKSPVSGRPGLGEALVGPPSHQQSVAGER